MEFTKKESFVKQLAAYFRNVETRKAYELAREFVKRFPDELASHFLLAKAAYEYGEYDEAKTEGRKAFNMSKTYEDALATAIFTSTVYLKLDEYDKGYELLKEMEGKGTSEELQTALLVFSVARKDKLEAIAHLDKLFKLNEKLATEFAMKIAGL